MGPVASRAIDLVRIVAILLVVVLHARTGIIFDDAGFSRFADIVSRGFGALGVPLFLAVSGLLAGIKRDASAGRRPAPWSALDRIWKLVLMYMFWNSAVWALAAASSRAGLDVGQFNAAKLAGGPVSVYGFDSTYPIAYQFWFIRELIVCSILAALLERWLRPPWLLATAIAALAIATIVLGDARTGVVGGFFAAGYLGGLHSRRLPTLDARYLGLAFFALSGLSLVALNRSRGGVVADNPFDYVFMVCGCASVLLAALLIAPHALNMPRIKLLAESTFFVFAFHEPLLTVVKKVIGRFGEPTIVYAISPWVTICLALTAFFSIPRSERARFGIIFGSGAQRSHARPKVNVQ